MRLIKFRVYSVDLGLSGSGFEIAERTSVSSGLSDLKIRFNIPDKTCGPFSFSISRTDIIEPVFRSFPQLQMYGITL